MQFGKKRYADGGGREYKPDKQRVECNDAEVTGPAPKAPDGLGSPWRQQFPESHCGKNTDENAQTDGGFVMEQDLGQVRNSSPRA